jgi:phage terminase large subunit-like protein
MKLFGAFQQEDVERFRSGGNRCFLWAEEMAAWRYLDEVWEQIRYGLRVGPRPHVIISTTPKARRLIKKLVKEADINDGVVSSASTFTNPHLDDRVKRSLKEDYDGTRMGRQELYAEILEDIEGALWTPEIIDDNRLSLYSFPDEINKIVVGVDPQAKEGGDDTGIVVAGVVNSGYRGDPRSHGFILGDYSYNGQPEEWARQAVRAYDDHMANEVVAEINNGGDMVKSVLRTQRGSLPIHVVHATRGKEKRAEPISALYEQGRVHHVGLFNKLEDQMTGWDPIDPDPSWSPDRMDAMVWALTRLMVRRGATVSTRNKEASLRGRR